MSRLHALRRAEDGYSLPELLVALLAGSVVMLMVSQILIVTMRETGRVTGRVDANQRGRLVMYQIIDELHSSCVAPQTIPIKAGSTGTSMSFVYARGSAVTPTPDLRNISLNAGVLTESVYNTTGGVAPNWTFSTTATSTRELLENVAAPSGVQPFRYFAYSGGSISATPLTTPLSEADAAKTAQVTVSFDASAGRTEMIDPNQAVTLENSALLRFSPPSYDAGATNAPCQ